MPQVSRSVCSSPEQSKALSAPPLFPPSSYSFRVSLLAQAGLELETVLPPQLSKSWEHRHEPPYPTPFVSLCARQRCGALGSSTVERAEELTPCLRKELHPTVRRAASSVVNLVSSPVKWG